MLIDGALDMPSAILERLRCPRCGGLINRRGLTCENGHAMRVRAGYIDALAAPPDALTARTLTSFGYEHTTFVERRREQERYWRYLFAGVPLDELKDATGLEVGCGGGRFSGFLATHMRALVALDGSMAVETAARNLAELPNTVVVRSDLREAPFGPGSFDFIACIGVLHHLDYAPDAFRSLTKLLAPGGRILIFVYSRPKPGTARSLVVGTATALRRMTVHLPYPYLRAVSAVVASWLYIGVVLPGKLGERLRIGPLASLPLAFYRRLPLKSLWLSAFDVLSAPLERRYAWPDIRPWFEDSHLTVDSVRDDHGLIVMAHRAE
jgi:SAM-dependent methyltransferase